MKKLKTFFYIVIILIIMSNICFGSTQSSKPKTIYYDSNGKVISSEEFYKNASKTNKESKVSTYELLKDLFISAFENSTQDIRMSISEENIKNNNISVGIFTIFLFIYWIFLIIKFEKEKYITVEPCDDLEILNKYNPLIAGCLVDNREVLSRDLIAVLVNLINKNIIKLDIVPLENTEYSVDPNKKYKYILTRIKENEHKMDRVEAYIHGIFFNHSYNDGNTIRLDEALEELNKDKLLNEKVKNINNIAAEQLHSIGGNLHSVPVAIQILDFCLLFISVLLGVYHFISNSLFVNINGETIFIFFVTLFIFIFAFPLIVLILQIFLIFVNYIKRLINKINEKYTAQKIISTSIAIWLVILTLIILSILLLHDYVLIMDILMIGIAFLIVKTDHLMTKNSDEILSDYYNLNYIKYKIEEYSLLDEKNLQFITLWEEYLAYAISFGFSKPIMDKLRKTYDDDFNIKKLLEIETLSKVCESYLDFMFGINLSSNKLYSKATLSKENKRSDLDFWFNSK